MVTVYRRCWFTDASMEGGVECFVADDEYADPQRAFLCLFDWGVSEVGVMWSLDEQSITVAVRVGDTTQVQTGWTPEKLADLVGDCSVDRLQERFGRPS